MSREGQQEPHGEGLQGSSKRESKRSNIVTNSTDLKKSTIRLCKLRQTCCMSDPHNTTTYVLLSPVLQMRRPRLSKISSVQFS